MSGGSYDYAYGKVDEFAHALEFEGSCDAAHPILRMAFAEHCRVVAEAMRACEWNDSCDGHDRETELILKVVNHKEITEAARKILSEKFEKHKLDNIEDLEQLKSKINYFVEYLFNQLTKEG